ncbi:succinate dehydrogenase / fumarate reductase iron-sulfur subunit [Verrucomicrobium sp. GAS474]|uniref:succinate dehydrogenase/fumarate reductase iron-sulfur subunit n=1 Tax=Verrucomicrobium sp. GAS474 TaxID=1882831 RepID=UPI00087CCB5C|nr:succinate dehydrogenase/fumarate reductase iron-sulfur subunit [Verrucomicrobium sp. GAS474]SDU30270.1 succinate dehydrogenase / fumarate reductase iron-sulfur subunit [Verrucomicrobium sp. GAS474]
MNFTLKIWRQESPEAEGRFVTYQAHGINPNMSFLEMLDVVNDEASVNPNKDARDTIAFDHDCREGICGTCSLVINGKPHGPNHAVTTCQTYMRSFTDGETIVVEPWRVAAFPVLKDLVTDRSAFDRIIQSGGYVSVSTGQAPAANTHLIPRPVAEAAFDAAHCIGCGACAAQCKNGSPMLFVAAKVAHLNSLPQGQPEKHDRVLKMVRALDDEGFGACTHTMACEAVCPKEIPYDLIVRLNRQFLVASAVEATTPAPSDAGGAG